MAALTDAVRARFGDDLGKEIGHGGEATVFALGADRVLRLYHEKREDLTALAEFYNQLADAEFGFAVPRVLEHGEIDDLAYTIDARIPGRDLMDALAHETGMIRLRTLDSYLDGATAIARARLAQTYYGELLRSDPIRSDSWIEFLSARIARSLELSGGDLRSDVPRLHDALSSIGRRIDALPRDPGHRLVHGDYFPGNVMIDASGEVTGIVDFGSLTVVGDPMMDVSSAVIFLEMLRPAYRPEDSAYLMQRLTANRGADVAETVECYRGFYAIRLSNSKTADQRLYRWCVRVLSDFSHA